MAVYGGPPVSRGPPGPQNPFHELNIEGGWPPGLRDAQKVKTFYASPVLSTFSDADRRRNLEIALGQPEVQARLIGRWEALGCDLTYAPTSNAPSRDCVTLCLYNYTSNQMFHVYLDDGKVTSIVNKEPWQHPATRLEMAQAIGLARTHGDLRDVVSDLEGHAILRVFLEPNHPCFRHRCLDVTFTQRDDLHIEQRVLFKAIVDLSAQSVVVSGRAPCGVLSAPPR